MNCAIYIDADNVSYKNLDEIIYQSNNCNIIIKKIYADWTSGLMQKWAKKAKQNGFQGIQCFGNDFKQTSDIYMITDIINDLYTNKNIEMVVLATSDIDFTHLCHIIKSHNKKLLIYTPQKSSISNLVESDEISSEKKVIIKKKKKNKKQKISNYENIIDTYDENLEYLKSAMKDCLSIYISKYKQNLRKIVPAGKKLFDLNHIDKDLVKYPKDFGLVKKGNKVKIYGLFHLFKYSKNEFINNKEDLQVKYKEILDNFNYSKILDLF